MINIPFLTYNPFLNHGSSCCHFGLIPDTVWTGKNPILVGRDVLKSSIPTLGLSFRMSWVLSIPQDEDSTTCSRVGPSPRKKCFTLLRLSFLVVVLWFVLSWQTLLSKKSQHSKIGIIIPINFISKLLNLLHAFFECWCHLVSCTNSAASLFMQNVFKMLKMFKMFLWKAFFVVTQSRNAMAPSLLKCCEMILTLVKYEGFLHIPNSPLVARKAK